MGRMWWLPAGVDLFMRLMVGVRQDARVAEGSPSGQG